VCADQHARGLFQGGRLARSGILSRREVDPVRKGAYRRHPTGPEREEEMTMETSGASPMPPAHHVHLLNALKRKPLTAGRAARIIASFTLIVTVVSGIVIHWTDPDNFPNVGKGLWWAVQTVTTVGYGDVVPSTTLGRLVASAVMIVGIGFLTIITATITSAFVETSRRRFEGRETDVLSGKLDSLGGRLDTIEAMLRQLSPPNQDALS
jgi:voltage-gated potassium channel Kch